MQEERATMLRLPISESYFKMKPWLEDLKFLRPSQSAFTCSKLTIATQEQSVKYVQS